MSDATYTKGDGGTNGMRSIGHDAAMYLAEARWWEGRTAREIAEFQLSIHELCIPLDRFHKAVQDALVRPVFQHEFGWPQLLAIELRGDAPAPSFDDILRLIPEEKRIVFPVDPANGGS